MIDMEKVIKGLEFTKEMITFNPSTGEDIDPENLNEANKTTYDACVGAIALLKEQEETKEQFIEAFNTIRDAYNAPVNRGKILLNYLARNACCCADREVR